MLSVADDDGRRRQQHVVQEARRGSQPAALAVFRQVGAGQDADRRADQRAHARHDHAAEDRVDQAAGLPRRRRDLGEQRVRQRGRALGQQRQNDPEQPEQAKPQGSEGHRQHDAVDHAAPAVDAILHIESSCLRRQTGEPAAPWPGPARSS
ncbi:hypothetical protein G6F57_019993 [Rhizopus arrhizus]|nr:hypothetical protein G6F57_019993 [Rhizopus arrhizus]